jgi:UDPglucose 6-dehydrogenase
MKSWVWIRTCKLSLLQRGKSPIHEAGLQTLLDQTAKDIDFTDNTSDAVANGDIIMIAVGTPQKQSGEANARYVEEAAHDVAQGLESNRKYTLVVKSTMPIGTNHRVAHVVNRTVPARCRDRHIFCL